MEGKKLSIKDRLSAGLCIVALYGVWSPAYSSTNDNNVSPQIAGSLADSFARSEEAVSAREYTKAQRILRDALQSRDASQQDIGLELKAWHRLAQISGMTGEHYAAIDQLNRAIKLSRVQNDKAELAQLQYELGVTYIAVGDYDSAIGSLTEAEQVARLPDAGILPIKIGIQLSNALIENNVPQGIGERLDELNKEIQRLPVSKEKAELLFSSGLLYHNAQRQLGLSADMRKKAYNAFLSGQEIEQARDDALLQSYLMGYIGQLYEDENRIGEAMEYTRKAAFSAQSISSFESLFKWEWQIARLLKAQNNNDAALDAYRQTVRSLRKVRLRLLLSARINFQRYISPIYYEYVDLLLKQATLSKDMDKRADLQREAIKVFEVYKIAEVENYFQSACVDSEEGSESANDVDPNTAVIYPIVLNDRVELLVSIKGTIYQFSNPVNKDTLISTVKSFREKIETSSNGNSFEEDAKALYRWLVEPYVKLAKDNSVTNFMYVSDGPLRTIPMSALYDGEKFLIETFTTSTTPSLSLTSIVRAKETGKKTLLNGITKQVGEFPALPSVDAELQNISTMFPAVMLKDEGFLTTRAEHELSQGDYSIVHVATHGVFSSDYRNSYLLTFDDKLTMSELEKTIGLRKYTNEPLDLLVLSACQTALGDDMAALGLAGVAIKAGARSAVATLWFISDKATSQLVSEFYQQLQRGAVTKAGALQQAQLSLINSKRYRNPYYWAPFLLIGNWL